MSKYWNLFRGQNLLLIAFIQLIIRQSILIPILQQFGFEANQNMTMLYLLIAATVFIAAGGYVLNDYFDIKIDAINHPEKQIIGKEISKRTAMFLHQILTAVGILCGLTLAFLGKSFTLGFIFIVVPGLLWFYSASYKRQFLTGNITIAFISGLSVLIVGINELALLRKEYGELIFQTPIPGQFYSWVGGFAIFAFLCTLLREIIKDMEDEPGDRELECRTMPVKWGFPKTKLFLYGLILIIIGGLFLSNNYIRFQGTLTMRYILIGLVLPLLILTYLIHTAKNKESFHQASTFAKFIMLSGILYSFVFYYLQAKTYGISLFNLFNLK